MHARTMEQGVDNSASTLTTGTAEDAARFWNLFDPLMGDLPAIALR